MRGGGGSDVVLIRNLGAEQGGELYDELLVEIVVVGCEQRYWLDLFCFVVAICHWWEWYTGLEVATVAKEGLVG